MSIYPTWLGAWSQLQPGSPSTKLPPVELHPQGLMLIVLVGGASGSRGVLRSPHSGINGFIGEGEVTCKTSRSAGYKPASPEDSTVARIPAVSELLCFTSPWFRHFVTMEENGCTHTFVCATRCCCSLWPLPFLPPMSPCNPQLAPPTYDHWERDTGFLQCGPQAGLLGKKAVGHQESGQCPAGQRARG